MSLERGIYTIVMIARLSRRKTSFCIFVTESTILMQRTMALWRFVVFRDCSPSWRVPGSKCRQCAKSHRLEITSKNNVCISSVGLTRSTLRVWNSILCFCCKKCYYSVHVNKAWLLGLSLSFECNLYCKITFLLPIIHGVRHTISQHTEDYATPDFTRMTQRKMY